MQLAEKHASQVSGVMNVANRLTVSSPGH
ncbi:hypothetical protein C6T53_02390 [Burkholderia multivorans]|nr:hypothetical protein C6T53_02390 [Burkholderia multivorans]